MKQNQLINNKEWLEGLRDHVSIQRGKYHSDKAYADSIGILPCYLSALLNNHWDRFSRPMRIKMAEQTGYDRDNLRKILADAPEQDIDYFLDPHNFKKEDKTASEELTEEVKEVIKSADNNYGVDFPYGPDYHADKTIPGMIERAIITPSEQSENRPYDKPCTKSDKELCISPVQEEPNKSFSQSLKAVAKDIQLINNYLQCREVIDLLPEDKRERHIQVLLNDLVSELHGV